MDTTEQMEARAIEEINLEAEKEEKDPEPRMRNCRLALIEAREPFKGQKKLIKQLLQNQDQVLQECTTEDMLRAIGSESFVETIEGRKLAAAFMPVVGYYYGWTLIREQAGHDRKTSQLEHLGEVMLMTWKNSTGSEKEYMTHNMMDMVYRALVCEDNVSVDFFWMLEPIRNTRRNKDMEIIVWRMMLANLWRCLKSRNDHVRLHAIQMLSRFYPVVSNDDFETGNYMYKQHEELKALLMDESVDIRVEAIHAVLLILSTFWVTLDADFIKYCLKTLMELASDEEDDVRLAVLENWTMMFPCPQAIKSNIRALSIIIPPGINDEIERIRVAAFKLLQALQGHRFIHFWHGVSMDELLMCFDVEDSEAVRTEMVKMILSTFKPTEVHPDEVIHRISYMGKRTRLGALSFHHIVVRDNLITVEQALEHIQMLAVAVYKELKPSDQGDITSVPVMNAKGATDNLIEPHNVAVVVDPTDEDESDGAKKWRTCQILLECGTMMWVMLRKSMVKEEHKLERTRTDKLLNKVFKGLFPVFKDTQMLAALCALGSCLDEDRESSAVVMQKLLSEELTAHSDQCYYLEVGASWNFMPILEFMQSGLKKLEAECLPAKKQNQKKATEGKCSAERGLRYLKLILLSPIMEQNLSTNHPAFLEIFYKDLKCVYGIIEELLSTKSKVPFQRRCPNINLVLMAFEYVHVMLIHLINSANCVSDHKTLENAVERDAVWFTDSILPKLTQSTDAQQRAFVGKLVQEELRMFSCHVQAHRNSHIYKRAVVDVLTMLTTKKTPVEFIVPVLKTLKNLIRNLDSKSDSQMTKETAIPLTCTILAWMGERCSDEDYPMKKTAKEFVSTLDALMTEKKDLMTKPILYEYAKLVLANTLPALVEHNKKDQDVMDPRAQAFKPPRVVSLFVGEIITKDKINLKATQTLLLTTVTNKAFVKRFQGTDVLYAYGAVMQLVLYLHKKLKGMHVNTKACMDKIGEQLAQLDQNVKNHDLYKKIDVLRDFMEVPQG